MVDLVLHLLHRLDHFRVLLAQSVTLSFTFRKLQLALDELLAFAFQLPLQLADPLDGVLNPSLLDRVLAVLLAVAGHFRLGLLKLVLHLLQPLAERLDLVLLVAGEELFLLPSVRAEHVPSLVIELLANSIVALFVRIHFVFGPFPLLAVQIGVRGIFEIAHLLVHQGDCLGMRQMRVLQILPEQRVLLVHSVHFAFELHKDLPKQPGVFPIPLVELLVDLAQVLDLGGESNELLQLAAPGAKVNILQLLAIHLRRQRVLRLKQVAL
mmetsp:Transcript_10756/g.30292  ORF Transcript_10756/g.30292 Transcript_10756/m.30292 type:complete len:267 (-) Transcript_10756:195-995(-)